MDNFLNFFSPYIASIISFIVIFITFFQTPFGGKVFDGILKRHLDVRMAELKHQQDRALTEIKFENDARIASIQHQGQSGIEKIRSELSIINNRGQLSNEREYNALVCCWESFVVAHQNTHGIVVKFTSRPDLDKFETEAALSYLRSRSISESNINFIMSSRDKNSAFGQVLRGIDLDDAAHSIFSAREMLQKQSLFITPEIELKFDKALADLQMVWAEQQTSFPSAVGLRMEATTRFISGDGNRMRSGLRDAVRERTLYKN